MIRPDLFAPTFPGVFLTGSLELPVRQAALTVRAVKTEISKGLLFGGLLYTREFYTNEILFMCFHDLNRLFQDTQLDVRYK